MLTNVVQISLSLLFVLMTGSWWFRLSIRMQWPCNAELIPLVGGATLTFISTVLWFSGVSIQNVFFIMLLQGLVSTTSLWMVRHLLPRFRHSNLTAGMACIAFTLILTIQGSTGPNEERMCQAFCFDRMSYVSAGIAFSTNTYRDLVRIKHAILDHGDYSYPHAHIIYGPALENAERRPAPIIMFSLLNYDASGSYSLLGNEYETFLRILEFFAFVFFLQNHSLQRVVGDGYCRIIFFRLLVSIYSRNEQLGHAAIDPVHYSLGSGDLPPARAKDGRCGKARKPRGSRSPRCFSQRGGGHLRRSIRLCHLGHRSFAYPRFRFV